MVDTKKYAAEKSARARTVRVTCRRLPGNHEATYQSPGSFPYMRSCCLFTGIWSARVYFLR